MATLSNLSGAVGPLTRIDILLPRRGQPQRAFYALPPFMEGLQSDLPTWQCGRLEASQTPEEQFDALLLRWISGNEMRYGKMFQDLMPNEDEVWEMKTPDLRVFGWVYKPRVFIVAILDYADWYKRPTVKKSYEDARRQVMLERDALELDEPKFTSGTYDALV